MIKPQLLLHFIFYKFIFFHYCYFNFCILHGSFKQKSLEMQVPYSNFKPDLTSCERIVDKTFIQNLDARRNYESIHQLNLLVIIKLLKY